MSSPTIHIMKESKAYIERAGFEVRLLDDGTLQVKDPYHLDGKANAGFDLVTIRTPREANLFIEKRS